MIERNNRRDWERLGEGDVERGGYLGDTVEENEAMPGFADYDVSVLFAGGFGGWGLCFHLVMGLRG